MSAAVIDGKAFAAGLREKVAGLVPAFEAAAGRKPGLAVVIVGEDPASQVYVRSKGKATEASGMASFTHKLPAETTEEALLDLVRQLNGDASVDGILVQLPLPRHIDESRVIATIGAKGKIFFVPLSGRLGVDASIAPDGTLTIHRATAASRSLLSKLILLPLRSNLRRLSGRTLRPEDDAIGVTGVTIDASEGRLTVSGSLTGR